MGKKSRRQRTPSLKSQTKSTNLRDITPYSARFNTRRLKGDISEIDLVNIYTTAEGMYLDEDDEGNLDEYIATTVLRTYLTDGMDSAMKATARWPRLRPYWRRIRRRICDECGKQVALTEPRFLVCSGCGVARYCCEACQIVDWPHHQTMCAAMARRRELMAREESESFSRFLRDYGGVGK